MSEQVGMTLKQMSKHRFYIALEQYKEALRTGKDLIWASMMIHAAKGGDGVTREMCRMVGRASKEIAKEKALTQV